MSRSSTSAARQQRVVTVERRREALKYWGGKALAKAGETLLAENKACTL